MEKTHWKKNLDSRYISGEDLKSSLNGLRPEMLVVIEKFNDAPTFNQKENKEVTATGLFLKEVGGKSLYKPTILNRTNAKFFIKETGSEFLEDWLNKPVTLFAQPDSRHGFVVRFKSFKPIPLVAGTPNFEACKAAILAGKATIDVIKLKYSFGKDVEDLLCSK